MTTTTMSSNKRPERMNLNISFGVSYLFFPRSGILYFIFSATYMYCVCLFNFAARAYFSVWINSEVSSLWMWTRTYTIRLLLLFFLFALASARFFFLYFYYHSMFLATLLLLLFILIEMDKSQSRSSLRGFFLLFSHLIDLYLIYLFELEKIYIFLSLSFTELGSVYNLPCAEAFSL